MFWYGDGRGAVRVEVDVSQSVAGGEEEGRRLGLRRRRRIYRAWVSRRAAHEWRHVVVTVMEG